MTDLSCKLDKVGAEPISLPVAPGAQSSLSLDALEFKPSRSPGIEPRQHLVQEQGSGNSATMSAPVLSVIIPAYNEEKRLAPALEATLTYLAGLKLPHEIIVVDDGSTDGTADLVRRFAVERPQVQLLEVKPNRGKGNAVRSGALISRGDYILFADADGSTPIEELSRLKAEIDGGSQIAIASRAMKSKECKVVTSLSRKCIGRIGNFVFNLFLLPGIKDTQCGFKMFSRDAARFVFSNQQAERFSFDLEILYLASKAGLRIKEIPVNWNIVAGSKVNPLLDGAKMLKDLFVFRWRHRRVSPATYRSFLESTQKAKPV